ncbi:GNAT domain [Dillenia turbinata]|uniref:GNAT domain n=1 Tax=Dillenia turbinata TaxID=194707 RepID=A0AAN8UWQ0_9MAGN
MATTLSLSIFLDTHHHRHQQNYLPFSHKPLNQLTDLSLPKTSLSPLLISKSHFLNPQFSHSSEVPTTSSSTPSSYLQNPLRKGKFLSNEELEKLKFLENFIYTCELPTGVLYVRVMKPEELDITVRLLSESFAESMLLPSGYVKFLGFLVKQYLIERKSLIPHTATLIGFYRCAEDEFGGEGELAGTVEVSFDKRGANASPPTPTPPKNSPYVCNMTVKKPLRRRGIGWHLLKASEELISQMSSSKDVYLHCRIIDLAPFNMYTKAGYNIVQTDSILILLTLQRRKHLMRKGLPMSNNQPETNILDSNEEFPS